MALLLQSRLHYNRFQDAVAAIIPAPTDAVVIARLGDDLDEYVQLVQQVHGKYKTSGAISQPAIEHWNLSATQT
jgi:hypothetical protein